MERVHEGELDPFDVDRAALVGARHLADFGALIAEPPLQLDEGDDLRRELLRDLDGAADVVGMTVGDGDDVGPLWLLLIVRAFRVLEPRIDIDPLAVWTVDPKGRVPEPGDGNVRHSPSSSLTARA